MLNNTNEINKLITNRLQRIKSDISAMPGLIQSAITNDARLINFKQDNLVKLSIGIITDPQGSNFIPTLRFGAGDGSNSNMGYLTKDTTGLNLFYVGDYSQNQITGLSLQVGKIVATHPIEISDELGNKLLLSVPNINAKITEADAKSALETNKGWKIHTNNLAAGAKWDNKTTLIGTDGIYTGKVTCNQLDVGTLTGFTIQTATSGARLVLNSDGLNTLNGTTKHGWQMSTIGNFGMLDGYANGTQYAQLQVNQTFTSLSATRGILQLVSENSDVEIKSSSAYGGTGKVNFTGNVNFSNATCTGLKAVFG